MNRCEIDPARGGLRGEVTIPGDKSVSHRAVIFSSLAEGSSYVRNFLCGEDNYRTVEAFRRMGVPIEEKGDNLLRIQGRGLDGLKEPEDVLDCGNSGTTIRLLSGLLAGQPFFSVLTGDQYLRKRPMKRVVKPLSEMGARIWGRSQGDLPPLAIHGGRLRPISYDSPIASAQVKSALLLAGLYCDGVTTVREPCLSRDHTERMLPFFGADLHPVAGGVALTGRPRLHGCEVTVPGDISSAAFFMVAALIVPHSELLIRNVGVNPTRDGIIEALRRMGGDLELVDERLAAGEPVADILVRGSRLKGIEIGGSLIPRMIDEIPVFTVAAALAEGTSVVRDAQELRVKETDRIASMTSELTKLGGEVEARPDGMVITGRERLQGGKVLSHGDHRIAMSMAVAGLRALSPVEVEDIACTATSFPGFWVLLGRLAGFEGH
ncbi:MAG: 3-phosphoshikimate 1-carboxyvinyltransferase [Desulfuromonadaceae bacterium]|nr:3-phosphoshikimate 1-carboxyvinyltransferase [Desulfuromonadaceae bacterium]